MRADAQQPWWRVRDRPVDWQAPGGDVSDARFVGKNSNVVVERLLSISGEDTLTVNRKYREQWTGKLPTRLHVVSNELPRLGDASSAVIGRIVLLILTDPGLAARITASKPSLREELTGILNWALEGLHRLTVQNRNTFTHTASAVDAIVTMRDLASPVAAFVREKCELGRDESGKDYEISRDDLYSAYRLWCEANGHPRPTKEILGRDLKAAFPSIRDTRPREEEARPRSYAGIRLCPDQSPKTNASSRENIGGPPGPPGPEDALDRDDGPKYYDGSGGPGGPGGPAMFLPLDTDGGGPPLGTCAQCNGPAPDAPLVWGEGYPPAGAHLHPECRRFWLKALEERGGVR